MVAAGESASSMAESLAAPGVNEDDSKVSVKESESDPYRRSSTRNSRTRRQSPAAELDPE